MRPVKSISLLTYFVLLMCNVCVADTEELNVVCYVNMLISEYTELLEMMGKMFICQESLLSVTCVFLGIWFGVLRKPHSTEKLIGEMIHLFLLSIRPQLALG